MSLQLSAHDLAETVEMHNQKTAKKKAKVAAHQRRRRMSYNNIPVPVSPSTAPAGTQGPPGASPTASGAPEVEKAAGARPRLPWFIPAVMVNEDGVMINPNIRERIYLTFEEATLSKVGFFISLLVITLIFISSLCFVLESQPEFRSQPARPCWDARSCMPKPDKAFELIEAICIAVFTLEYLARLFTAHAVRPPPPAIRVDVLGNEIVEKQRPTNGIQRTFIFLLSPMNMIDLVAILPFYVDKLIGDQDGGGGGLSVLRILRLARVFRVFKLGKYNEGMQMFGRVIVASTSALYLLGFFMGLSVVLFGAMIYFMEEGTFYPGYNEDGSLRVFPDINGMPRHFPDGVYMRETINGDCESSGQTLDVCGEPSPFTSITRSFWWVFTTQTTVGYGDMYPTSTAGKAVGMFTMVSGILVLALPITIIGANFANEYGKEEAKRAAKEQEDALLALGAAQAIDEGEEAEEDEPPKAKSETSTDDVFASAFAPNKTRKKTGSSSRVVPMIPVDAAGIPILPGDEPLLESVAAINPETLTPMQALALLAQLKQRAVKERRGSVGSERRSSAGSGAGSEEQG